MERERGFLAYKRALPMPPGAYLFAKMAMAMLFSMLISAMLAVLAGTLGGVSLEPWQWLALLAINVASVLPFCAIGLFIGTLVGGQGAPAVLNLLYLPMAFLSGLWLPLAMLPQLFAPLAPTWPPYHLRSEEHTSELQSLMRISYAVFCLKKKTNNDVTEVQFCCHD